MKMTKGKILLVKATQSKKKLYVKWAASDNLSLSTGSSAQCSVGGWEGRPRGRGYIQVADSLHCTAEACTTL